MVRKMLREGKAEHMAHFRKDRKEYREKQNKNRSKRQINTSTMLMEQILPNFDWRKFTNCQSVSDVRSQACSDCWAVSSSAVISDRYCLATGINRTFAAKQADFCASSNGCDGGYGGDTYNMYLSGMASGGDPQSTIPESPGCIPYTNLDNPITCPTSCNNGSKEDLKYGLGYGSILSSDFPSMDAYINATMWQIYQYGPVSVGVDGSPGGPMYNGNKWTPGIFTNTQNQTCCTDHEVRVIGWGIDSTTNIKYWIIKNQWGASSDGYNVQRGFLSHQCGVDDKVIYPYPAELYKSCTA